MITKWSDINALEVRYFNNFLSNIFIQEMLPDPQRTSTSMTSPRLTPKDDSSFQEFPVPQESASSEVPTPKILSFTTPKSLLDNLKIGDLLTSHTSYGYLMLPMLFYVPWNNARSDYDLFIQMLLSNFN